MPIFVEHLLLATLSENTEDEVIDTLIRMLEQTLEMPGVLAAHVGRCVSVLSDHTFLMHIRAVDDASADAAYEAAIEACSNYFAILSMDPMKFFRDMLIVDYQATAVGTSSDKFGAIRIALVKFKTGTSEKRLRSAEEFLKVLPSKFPVVKQVTWGANRARQKMSRTFYEYADVDQELMFLLGFESSKDMERLGNDPKYWEYINYYGMSSMDIYQLLLYND